MATDVTVAGAIGSMVGAGALAVIDRLLVRRKTNAEADSITAVATRTATDVFRELVTELRAEMVRREGECQKEIDRLQAKVASLEIFVRGMDNR